MTRAQMLLLSLMLMHLLLGVLSLVVSSGVRGIRALQLWGWGLVCFAAGAATSVFGNFLGVALKQIAGNGLIAFAGLLAASAIARYTHYRLPDVLSVGGVALVVVVITLNHLQPGPYQPIVDVAAPTLYGSCLFLVAATMLLLDPPKPAIAAARFVAITAYLAVLLWNVRLAAIGFALQAADPLRTDFVISISAIGQGLSLVATSLGLMWMEVRRMEDELRRMAVTDGLTGLLNRRGMAQRFEQGLSLARREGEPYALVMFDVDHFKNINDAHGHLAGDTALRKIAHLLGHEKRNEDVLGRIGGEEFLLLLQNKGPQEAKEMAERLRRRVQGTQIGIEKGLVSVTLSAGVAAYPDDGESWDKLFGAADRRLYIAKASGRNCVVAKDAIATRNGAEASVLKPTGKNSEG